MKVIKKMKYHTLIQVSGEPIQNTSRRSCVKETHGGPENALKHLIVQL